jgi:hypothetical protein
MDTLPDELIYEIMSKLDVVDIVNMMVTSKRYKRLASSHGFKDLSYNICEELYDLSYDYGSLQISMTIKKLSSSTRIGKVYKLVIARVDANLDIHTHRDLCMLSSAHTLILSRCPISDVSMLGNVHTLDLSRCPVSDVSMLGDVHTLDLSGSLVSDVSMLGNANTLDLSGCPVSDVSMLGNVDTLIL